MVNKISVSAVTPSAILSYSVNFNVVESIFINSINKVKFDTMCEEGCPNYRKKWACPPFSPTFHEYSANLKYTHIAFLSMQLNQFDYIRNDYLKLKAANSILKSKADRILRKLSCDYGKYVSSGSCRLCKPCKCKLGEACMFPEKMAYSFEALGVDVNALIEDYFNSELLWYKKGYLPEYTSVVCGILSNVAIPFNTFHDFYLENK